MESGKGKDRRGWGWYSALSAADEPSPSSARGDALGSPRHWQRERMTAKEGVELSSIFGVRGWTNS